MKILIAILLFIIALLGWCCYSHNHGHQKSNFSESGDVVLIERTDNFSSPHALPHDTQGVTIFKFSAKASSTSDVKIKDFSFTADPTPTLSSPVTEIKNLKLSSGGVQLDVVRDLASTTVFTIDYIIRAGETREFTLTADTASPPSGTTLQPLLFEADAMWLNDGVKALVVRTVNLLAMYLYNPEPTAKLVF